MWSRDVVIAKSARLLIQIKARLASACLVYSGNRFDQLRRAGSRQRIAGRDVLKAIGRQARDDVARGPALKADENEALISVQSVIIYILFSDPNVTSINATKAECIFGMIVAEEIFTPWIQIRPDNGQKKVSKKKSARRMLEGRWWNMNVKPSLLAKRPHVWKSFD
jgi:hypothetical protein